MSRTALVSVITAAALLVAAFVFNPTPEKHRATIQDVIADRSPLAGLLGIGALTAFTSTYRSWGLASYTTVNGRVVSIGAFGLVFVTRSPMDE